MSVTFGDLFAGGLSARQIHTWTKAGHLRANAVAPGSGHPRTWPDAELAIGVLIVRLLDAGLTLDAAAEVARADYTLHQLAPGVWVMVIDPERPADEAPNQEVEAAA